MRRSWLFIPLLSILSACSDAPSETAPAADGNFPVHNKDERREARGHALGDDGGLALLGRKESDNSGGSANIGVNGFLWRATLDTLSFMPFASADPFGGVVLTDWYENPNAPGERFKVNAVILDKTLRADGVRISVFKQKMDKGAWRDQPVDNKLARQLEDTILTRARQLKIGQISK